MCVPNSPDKHCALKDDFYHNWFNYRCDLSKDFHVDVEMIDRCINKLKRGKGAGMDGLNVEHLMFAHPIIVQQLAQLFQIIIHVAVVHTNFGCGVIIPLIKNRDGDASSSDNYRGIMLGPVISKLFELVLMEMVRDKLTSSYLKFGFKSKSSCNHAIFTLRMLVKHYCSFGSTLTLGALDISKAFDRVNFYGLMNVLMARRFPRSFIGNMYRPNWLHKCVGIVRWENCFSSVFAVTAGVRQGGLLSPALFCSFHGQSHYSFEVVKIRLLLARSLLWVLSVC